MSESILEEIYKMELETLRKYCISLLRQNTEHFRNRNQLSWKCSKCKKDLRDKKLVV